MNQELMEELSMIVDYLDKSIRLMDLYGLDSREQNIARQKLEEAVFWLTYGMEEQQIVYSFCLWYN